MGVSSLYNSFEDVWEAVQLIKKVTESGTYKNYETTVTAVT
ncbi:MAG: hypothetical protein U5K00_09970 [Melioribacteraceae bacterium]|nr:hypothetical protein [Melioribacteraceae bacterium]